MTEYVTYTDFKPMGLSLAEVYIRRLCRNGKFPKPVKGRGIVGFPMGSTRAKFYWRRNDVEEFIDSRKKPKHE